MRQVGYESPLVPRAGYPEAGVRKTYGKKNPYVSERPYKLAICISGYQYFFPRARGRQREESEEEGNGSLVS